jgi:hypothetical protein
MMRIVTFRTKARAQAAGFCLLATLLVTPAMASGPSLDVVLDRTAQHAERFVQQLPDVKCTERVVQAKLGKGEKAQYQEESTFDFLLMPQVRAGEIAVEESRLALAEPRHRKNLPLLVTNGFSTLMLIFHPVYRESFEFDPMPDEQLEGRPVSRVHFRHVRGKRSPSALILRGREYPLRLEGDAWIDTGTGAILRLSVGLLTSMEDVGLRAFHADVSYRATSFTAAPQSYWLPVTATIEVETLRQHWRNVHSFADYKLFSVSSSSTIKDQP